MLDNTAISNTLLLIIFLVLMSLLMQGYIKENCYYKMKYIMAVEEHTWHEVAQHTNLDLQLHIQIEISLQ